MPNPQSAATPASFLPSSDRRASPRLPASASLMCRVLLGGEDLQGCRVLDLSGYGVGLSVLGPVQPGVRLCVVLTNRAAFHQYIAIARVARCDGPDGGVYRLGIRLLNPLPDVEVQRLAC